MTSRPLPPKGDLEPADVRPGGAVVRRLAGIFGKDGSSATRQPEASPPPVHDGRAVPARTDLDQMIGSAFIWHTGTTGILRGYAEDASISGNWYERLVLIFEGVGACAGTLHTHPAHGFLPLLRPAPELVITDSDADAAVFGPFPVDGYEEALAAAYEAHEKRWSGRVAARPYATPGTPEHDEYQRLTLEILGCTDIARARALARRMGELRGDR